MRRVIKKFIAFFRVIPNKNIDAKAHGKIIGYTKSGRAIYEEYKNIKHKKFNTHDHYDALNCHKKILERLSIQNVSDDKIKFHRRQAHQHFMSSVR